MKNIAVIGCGYWGKNLVRNFYELGSLAAVCDPIEAVAKTFSEKYHTSARSWEDILKDTSIHSIVLSVPAPLHAKLCIEALEAGKDVFVEKPLALTEAEGLRIKATLQKTSRILLVGHLFRYYPAIEIIHKLVTSGTIGTLRYIRAHWFNFGIIRSAENALWSIAPHAFSIVHSLVPSDIRLITARGQLFFQDKLVDRADVSIIYHSGVHAEVCVSWIHPFKERKLIVCGTEGMLVFDDLLPSEQKLQLYRHVYARNGQSVITEKADPEDIPLPSTEPLKAECQHFIDCMRTRKQPRTDIDEGLAVFTCFSWRRRVWIMSNYLVHESSCVDERCTIGAGTKIWHFSHIMPCAVIGENCNIGQNVFIDRNVHIGNCCKIQNNVSVYNGVQLEDDVFCGPSCVFTNVYNPRATVERKNEFLKTLVKQGATIGANATIICGITLGEYCFIGAGTVVTKNVPPYVCAVGNPARQIGWRCACGEKLTKILQCARCGLRF